jgi:hypothetical protein
VQANTCRYNIPQALYLRGGSFDFSLGGGWKISKIISCNPRKERKNHATYNREKKYHAKESAQKKFLHVNLLKLFTSALYPQACKILHF